MKKEKFYELITTKRVINKNDFYELPKTAKYIGGENIENSDLRIIYFSNPQKTVLYSVLRKY